MKNVKPFCENSTQVLEHINPAKKVRVYRNLHKKCVSVKQDGIVRDTVYYNPYTVDHWVRSNLPYDRYVDTAEWCDVWCDEVCGDVLAFNLEYLQVMA